MAFQDKGDCFYFIADYHALNTVFDGEEFASNVYETYLDFLALGIDLDKTIFYVESHVPEIFELTQILKNVVSVAHMQKMHAFKDKLADPTQGIDSVNMGLFSYPILMAADILLFEPDVIPVGEDQTQHVEVARDIAKSFNHRYGNVLKVPKLHVKDDVARVPGTDGERKMSKSLENDLTIFADEAEIKKQVMGITTDPNRIHKDDPGDPDKNVIFTYMKLMDYDDKQREEFEERYRAGTVGDVEIKQAFLEFYLDYFAEARAKREEYAKDKEAIIEMMRAQAEKANAAADIVMKRVRKAIGAVYL